MEPQSSPKFMKPFEVFMRGRKRQRELDDDYSPLKCLSGNNSQSEPAVITSPSSSLNKVRRRIALTPVKTGSPSQENDILIHDQENNHSPVNNMARHGIKRQLNFGGIFSPSSPSKHTPQSQVSCKSTSPTTAVTDAKQSSGRKDKRKRKSVSTDETTSTTKQMPITAMFKPINTPANKQKADELMTTKPSSSSSSLTQSIPATTSANLPIDWSLKTRIRITCKNFPQQLHRGYFNLSEDAAGVTSFTRCISHSCDNPAATATTANPTNTCSQSSSSFAPQMDTSGPAILRQNTIVWSFPSIAYLQPLFPRMGAQVNSSAGTTPASGSLSQAAIECLEKEFTQSLRSLIALCKTRQCAFFYVCAATFTVLFRAAGVGGARDMIHALVTPTTKGFRKLLTDNDIGFVAPYDKTSAATPTTASKTPDSSESAIEKDDVAEEEIITLGDDDEDPDTILTELGLSQHDFPSLQSKPKCKKNSSKSSTTSLSSYQGDRSLILITGTDVQPFANLLCHSVTKIASAKTGRLAGVPPTILSPVAFIGSTLTPFKIKHARNKGNSMDPTPVETFDIIGPILPTNVTALVKQFRSLVTDAESGNGSSPAATTITTINMMQEENTTPFTHVSSLSSVDKAPGSSTTTPTTTPTTAADPSGSSFGAGVFLQQSLSDSGIPSETIAHLCSPSSQARKPVKEVIFCPQQEYLSYT